MELHVWFEVGSLVVLVLILVGDLLLILKRPHIPSTKESTLWVVFYVCLALVFAGLLWVFAGHEYAGQFIAGWLTEYSLSIDNLFVFVLIMSQFAVPRRYQQEVLMVGIIIALVLRGLFILAGAAIIEQFSWVFYIFGIFLVLTAAKLAREAGHEQDAEEERDSRIVKLVRRVVPVTDDYHGDRFLTRVGGRRAATPMLLALVAIGFTDLLFALDSIPAIYGLTEEPYIVFTANAFALMGLRQLYFLIGGLLDRLIYLSAGLSLILGFIGIKLVLHALHKNSLPFINGGEYVDVPEISTQMSITVITAILVVTTVASLVVTGRRTAKAK